MNPNQQKTLLNNMSLVHYIVQKEFNILTGSMEYDDMVSIGTIGLIKAILKYDKSRGTKFSAFAVPCIMNEIRMSFRSKNKYAFDKSLEENIYLYNKNINNKNRDTRLEDVIEDTKCNIERDTIFKEQVIEALNIIFNCCKARDLIILLYRIAKIKQEDISKIFSIARSTVSKIEKINLREVRRIMECCEKYKKKFFISKEDETYYIKFFSKDVENWDIVWEKIQIKIKRENPCNLHIKYEEGEVTVSVCLEDFVIVAEIFRIILQIP